MVLTPDRSRRTAGTVSILAALVLLLQAVLLVNPAAADTEPELVPGNPQCKTYTLTEVAYFAGSEVDDDASKNGVVIDNVQYKDGNEAISFDWTSTTTIVKVIVKAADEAHVYSYPTGATSGSAVSVAKDAESRYGISHVSFCTDEVPSADVTVTCDLAQVELINPTKNAVTYTITGDGPDYTEEVPAGTTETLPLTIAEDATYDIAVLVGEVELASASGTYDCEKVSAPAASIGIVCDGDSSITLDNSGSELPVTYTITGVEGVTTVEVAAGATDTVPLSFEEDEAYDITVSADGMDDVTTSGTYDCEPPVVELCPAGTDNAGTPVSEVEDCDEDETEVEPDVVAPAAAVGATCDGVTATLDNTESDKAVDFTVVINGNEQTITVPAGASDAVSAALGNGDSWSAVIAAGDTVLADGGDTEDCTVEVLPNVVEKPQPAPAVAPAAQELPATGLGSTELLLMALLLMGLGGTMLLAPQARREI